MACNPAMSSWPTMARWVIRSSRWTSFSWIMCCLYLPGPIRYGCRDRNFPIPTQFAIPRARLLSANHAGSIGASSSKLPRALHRIGKSSPADQAHVITLPLVAQEIQNFADDPVACFADHSGRCRELLAKTDRAKHLTAAIDRLGKAVCICQPDVAGL